MAASADEHYSKAIELYNIKYDTKIAGLKSLQKSALNVVLSGKDCVCALPTGYGKSLIYEILSFVDQNCLVLIIAPLNAIMAQQIQKLGEVAICLSRKGTITKSENINYLFSHPEDILNNKKIIEIFRTEKVQSRKKYLVIDEAHCILEWGDEFWPDYKKLSSIRSLIACQVLALSATITEKGKKDIASNLLMKNCEAVCASPTRDNIELVVIKRPSATAKGMSASSPYDYIFERVLNELKEKGQKLPNYSHLL